MVSEEDKKLFLKGLLKGFVLGAIAGAVLRYLVID